MGEFVVLAVCLVVCFVVALWVIHKQTLSNRSAQAMFLQRQQFNFENQWRLWNQDRVASNQAISNLAGWNARLCDSHEKMGQQLLALAQGMETKLAHIITQHLDHGMKQIVAAVGKKPGDA